VFAEEAARWDRAMVSSALAGVVKCAEVSSHYKYRKSLFCLPGGYGQAAVGTPPVLRYCTPSNRSRRRR
jgi:hypothetical protein